ncbi:MAG: tRNA (adenosine(37)-N6)-threonylcarbamoyltransferase complex dimerization subunit type 1 TsaB [Mycobacterium sp.]
MSRAVLAVDTSTPAVVAAVLRRHDDGRIELLAEHITVDGHAHAELLTPNIVAAVGDAGLGMNDLDAVVVGCGPGPFTGLRVGMATAAAYGHALGVPVHGVCSLDAIGGLAMGPRDGDVLVITDARRREVYWARYRDGQRIDGPAVNAPGDVPSNGHERRIEFAHPTPVGLVAAVGDWGSPPEPLIPLYLRRPDAKTLAERGLA